MIRKIDRSPAVVYEGQIKIVQTQSFERWFVGLRDRRAKAKIVDRLRRLADRHEGDAKSVGDGVRELRLHFGPGYRIYYIWQGDVLIILLNGGDKDTQPRDIDRAKRLAKDVNDGIGTDSV